MYQVLIHDSGDAPYATFRGRDVKSVNIVDRRIVCFSVPNETLVTRRNGHVAMHGNSKHAYHSLRLAIQGTELMDTGSITLPMTAENREYLLAVRTGGYTKDEVVAQLDHREQALIRATERSGLPDAPDCEAIDAWLVRTHRVWWAGKGL
jgi:hypothetical protein